MNHLDTFSGIGGWALAARWMGWNTVAFVEKEKFCHRVLNKNFPGTPIHDDIFTFSGKPFRGRVDILTGSTPCQPFSQAGKREGSNDERHLFPEFLRVVAECQPRWIVIENVYGLLSIESGQVFEDYHAQLESKGYSVQTVCIPASALNAPHRRDRLWIVAHALDGEHRANGRPQSETNGIQGISGAKGLSGRVSGAVSDVADADNTGIGTSKGRPNAKRPPFGGQREQPQFESCGHAENATYPGREYESGRNETVGSSAAERASRELDAQRCGEDVPNTSRKRRGKAGRLRRDESQERIARSGQDARHANSDGLPIGRHKPGHETILSENGVADTGFIGNSESTGQQSGLDGQGEAQYGRTSSGLLGFEHDWISVATRFCRVDDVVPNRVDRLKSLGNAIVPQIAYEIFQAIEATENS